MTEREMKLAKQAAEKLTTEQGHDGLAHQPLVLAAF